MDSHGVQRGIRPVEDVMAMLLRRKTPWLLPAIAAAIACTASLRTLEEPEAAPSQEAPPPAPIDPGVFQPPAQILFAPRHSGWEEMVEDRLIRVLVVSNRTHFFLDGARQRGIVADSLSELETLLNRELKLVSSPLRAGLVSAS